MPDFETHRVGTSSELALSRELVAQIKQITEQFGNGIVPDNVFKAYEKLIKFYEADLKRY